MPGDPVFGPVFSISNTGNASGTGYDYIVDTFADLPASTGSLKIAYVRNSTYLSFPPHLSGTYLDELGGWKRGAPYAAFFDDNLAEWYDDADDTKRMKFELSTLPTATTRVINPPRQNGEMGIYLPELSDIIPDHAGSTSGNATYTIGTDFHGAIFRHARGFTANRITIEISNSKQSPNFFIALYQAANGGAGTAFLKAAANLSPVPGSGIYTLIFTGGAASFQPGEFYLLFGRSAAAGGAVTLRAHGTVAIDLFSVSVPTGLRPVRFKTNLSVDAGAPASFNPAIGGGVVTEAGTADTAALARISNV